MQADLLRWWNLALQPGLLFAQDIDGEDKTQVSLILAVLMKRPASMPCATTVKILTNYTRKCRASARSVRVHPRRAMAAPWADWENQPLPVIGMLLILIPVHASIITLAAIYPQVDAGQLPVTVLNPQPGEFIIDTCAAPGSKSTQTGLALGDQGLLLCLDASAPRRRACVKSTFRELPVL